MGIAFIFTVATLVFRDEDYYYYHYLIYKGTVNTCKDNII